MTSVGAAEMKGIVRHFEEMDDPRSPVNRRHRLTDIIVISVLGVVAGADGPSAIEVWANAQEHWLKRYLSLPGGIPSRDTFRRVLQSLKPTAFQQCFTAWINSLQQEQDERSAEQEEQDEESPRRISLARQVLAEIARA